MCSSFCICPVRLALFPFFLLAQLQVAWISLHLGQVFFRLVIHFERHGAVKDSEQCSWGHGPHWIGHRNRSVVAWGRTFSPGNHPVHVLFGGVRGGRLQTTYRVFWSSMNNGHYKAVICISGTGRGGTVPCLENAVFAWSYWHLRSKSRVVCKIQEFYQFHLGQIFKRWNIDNSLFCFAGVPYRQRH